MRADLILVAVMLFALAMVVMPVSPALSATVILRPNAAGDETNFNIGGTTPAPTNWESVDEASSDDDVTYVEEVGNSYAHDLYSLSDVSLSGSINSVTVYIHCKAGPTPAWPSAYTRIKTGGGAYNGTEITLSTSYATYSTSYSNNPGGGAWTWTQINALQAGLGMKKASNAQPKKSICTQVWVVVDYTPPTVTVTGTDIAPGGVSPGDTEVGMLKLSLVTDAGTATWTQVKVDLTGTAVDGDISSVEIWKDDGDGNWEGTGEDTQIDFSTFSSKSVTITFGTSQTITTSSQDYFVVYDISGGADPSHTAGANLNDNSYIIVSSPATVSASNFPIQTSGDMSLPVVLSSFTAVASDGEVTLHWRTESETDNLGFDVYRSLEENGFYERVTAELIRGAGSTVTQQIYTFSDRRIVNGVTYWYKLEDVAFDGTRTMHAPICVTPQAEEAVEVQAFPTEFGLSQNVPNPFNPATIVEYQLPEESYIFLFVYNLQGQFVRTLVEGRQNPGVKSVRWDGRDSRGDYVASGVYFYALKVDQQLIETKRMTLIR